MPRDLPHPQPDAAVARDISYASSARSRSGRAFIRTMENATGRIGLIRRAQGYEQELARGCDFWRVMMDRYALSLDVIRGALDDIPATGPLVVVSNHPYGILDGLALGHILSPARGDFRLLAHQVFQRAEALNRVVLPISFDKDRAAVALNLATRAKAIDFLRAGGAVGIFPGGTVSTAPRPFMRPMDPAWRAFTARMIAKSGATVVPIWFEGQNSTLFQLASHLSHTLRMALLVREFRTRVGRPVKLAIGEPITPASLSHFSADTKQMMDFLRRKTYELSPEALNPARLGYEFEVRHRQAGQEHGGWRLRFGARGADGSVRP
ncbi:MAG: putative hemolysin [Rhodobacteraceae bacterium HLUCCA12]|nr:MAG: putative hemolysin [Rhodobacteraceae bacterium HLUCCA12]